jgi:hypothetical protein
MLLNNKTQLLDENTPLSLGDISPKWEKILICLFGFLISSVNFSPSRGSGRRPRGYKIKKPLDFSRGF